MIFSILPWTLCVPTTLAFSVSLPPQLFSPIIPGKVLTTFNSLPNPIRYPHFTSPSGKWIMYDPDAWTSGFFPAIGYALNTRKTVCGATPDNGLGVGDWLGLARAASQGLVPLSVRNTVGHDVGFLSLPFLEELKINPTNETAASTVKSFANLLAARFDPVVGCTRSWDNGQKGQFIVIMDNIMNLELLFRATELTGDTRFREIAIAHADTTMRNHIRSDGSTYHVVVYDSNTGKVLKQRTRQGFSDSSTWARGQSWAMYGYAKMYRLTRNRVYLETARRVSDYFLHAIPSSGIVPWDFDAPTPAPADSSAAMVAVNALLLLNRIDIDEDLAQKWREAAIKILEDTTKFAWKPEWESLLSDGTVDKPTDNEKTGIVYGDYYFIEAGNELIALNLTQCL